MTQLLTPCAPDNAAVRRYAGLTRLHFQEGCVRRVYVKLTKLDLERLQKLAEQHRRHPSVEAAVLLDEALRRHEQAERQRQEVPVCS